MAASVKKRNPRMACQSLMVSAFLGVESKLKQYLMRFFISRQDVEDAVQETFIRAYKAEESQEIRSPKSFLFKVAKNLALSELARKSNQLTTCLGDLQSLDVIDNRLPVEDIVEIHQRLEAFCKIAESLSPQCQRVVVMRKVYGFSHKEISKRLNISVKTVENHLTRGLQLCAQRQESGAAGLGYIENKEKS
jgi:RNA polymerase sigma-70 factor (ECF subfamily)